MSKLQLPVSLISKGLSHSSDTGLLVAETANRLELLERCELQCNADAHPFSLYQPKYPRLRTAGKLI